MEQRRPNVPKEPSRQKDNIAVWSEMGVLGKEFKCLSLGEGAPGYKPPKFLVDHMIDVINENVQFNQYSRSFGHPILVEQVAKSYGPLLKRELNPMSEICITPGANGALNSFISGLIQEAGEEIVIIEPAFPPYFDHITICGGVVKTVGMDCVDGVWKLDMDKLRSVLSQKTRAFVLNSPHNPTGKCFSQEEMEAISKVLDDFPDVVVISDEVYDFLTFDGHKHIPFATVGSNWDRTISIYSGGKLLNATGWKVGWAIGPDYLIKLGGIIQNTITYSNNTPAQIAIARSLPLCYVS